MLRGGLYQQTSKASGSVSPAAAALRLQSLSLHICLAMGQRKTKLRPQSPPPPCSSPTSAYSVLSLPTLDYSQGSGANGNGPRQTTALKRTASTVSVTPARPPVGKNRKIKRRGSLKRQAQSEDLLAALRRKIEQEAKSLDEWVSQASPSARIPSLVDIAALAVASHVPMASAVSRLPLSQELKDAVEFRISPSFDETLACDKVYISNEGRSISYTGRGYSTTVMKTPFGRGFKNGRHAWLMHVDNSRVIGWMHVGVVNEERHATGCKTIWDGNPHPFREGEMARSSNGNFNSGIKRSDLGSESLHNHMT